MDEWKERAMDRLLLWSLLRCSPSRAVRAYVIEAVYLFWGMLGLRRELVTNQLSRGTQLAISKVGVALCQPLTPPYSLPLLSSSFFSVWLASRCFPLFSSPYLFPPMRLLPSSHSLILMALSILPKAGAGPTAVSRVYSPYIAHNLTLPILFKA
jgi:hypothetical protein